MNTERQKRQTRKHRNLIRWDRWCERGRRCCTALSMFAMFSMFAWYIIPGITMFQVCDACIFNCEQYITKRSIILFVCLYETDPMLKKTRWYINSLVRTLLMLKRPTHDRKRSKAREKSVSVDYTNKLELITNFNV